MNNLIRFSQLAISAVLMTSISANAMENNIELKEYIENIRQQFQGLVANSEGDTMSLNVSPIEVEVSTITLKDGNGLLNTYVINNKLGQGSSLVQSLKFTVTIGESRPAFTSNYATPENRWPDNYQSGQDYYTDSFYVYPEISDHYKKNDQHYPAKSHYKTPKRMPFAEFPGDSGYPDYSSQGGFGNQGRSWPGNQN